VCARMCVCVCGGGGWKAKGLEKWHTGDIFLCHGNARSHPMLVVL
jgi:hypothetical protein